MDVKAVIVGHGCLRENRVRAREMLVIGGRGVGVSEIESKRYA